MLPWSPKRRPRTSAKNLTFQALAGSRRSHRMAQSLVQQVSLVGLRHSGFLSLIQKTLVSNIALMFKMKAGRIGFLMELSPARRERAFRLKPSSSSCRVKERLLMTCIIAFMLLISVGLDGPRMDQPPELQVGPMPLKQCRSLL